MTKIDLGKNNHREWKALVCLMAGQWGEPHQDDLDLAIAHLREHWVKLKGTLHGKFLREYDTPTPDLTLRAFYRKILTKGFAGK